MSMIRRKTVLPIILALFVFFLFTATYLSGEKVTRLTNNPQFGNKPAGNSKTPASNQKEKANNVKPAPAPAAKIKSTSVAQVKVKPTTTQSTKASKQTSSYTYSPPIEDGRLLKADKIALYLDSILGHENHDLERLDCQDIDDARYKELKPAKNAKKGHIPFFFALNLKNNRELLPQLLGSLYTIGQYLGPQNIAVSIVEGNSDDGMFDILEALKPIFKKEGIYYEAKVSDINPKEGDRIVKLADLRNLALEPVWQDHESFDANTTVVFVNDVFICPNDLLELALQRAQLGAFQTCAMDWHFPGEDPLFYDVWVTRGLGGDSFFRILGTKTKEWDLSADLFFNDPVAKDRYESLLPFQVWSCWNGATAFSAQPLLEGVRFRGPVSAECYQGEPQLFGKDFWMRGYGKIAVVPSVNFGYEGGGKKAKDKKGYTAENIKGRTREKNKIKWQEKPPKEYLCMNGWDNQFNETWNKGFENMTAADFKNMPARVALKL